MHSKSIKVPVYKLLGKLIPNDRLFLELSFYVKMGYRLDLNNPQTYNEKLQWLKLFDRNPLYSQLVDKYEVKEWVAKRVGERYVIPTLGVWDKFNDINFEDLPNQFVLKCTHDSGGLVICKDKDTLDIDEAKKRINRSLSYNFYLEGREYPYKNVKPRIIAERYMEDNASFNHSDLTDYKIYCCNGRPVCILMCTDRSTKVKYYYFSPEWEFLRWDKTTQHEEEGFTLPKPDNLEEMLRLAEILSANIPTVRVDLYSISGKTYFGEMTFYSNSGFDLDITKECDSILGEKVTLPLNSNKV
jgi:hypothetical protein